MPKKAKKLTFFDLGFAIFAQKVLSMVPKSYILYLAKEKMKLPDIGRDIFHLLLTKNGFFSGTEKYQKYR